jgi:FGGY-family pentulose kinase
MNDRFYLGVDVGTGSVRAGIFDSVGKRLGTASHDIQIFRPEEDFVEQSSDDIWRAAGASVRGALAEASLRGSEICGIGFDATCSLVALDKDDRPVTASPTGRDDQNVIVWMDHRAMDQTARINETNHSVLQYVGGVISPEMETPKLLWMKEKLRASYDRAARFFDLPDFLVYRATGADVRSLCSTVCKWTYLGREDKWDATYFDAIGLGDIGFERIGTRVRPMGELAGKLTERAAQELGLAAGIPVGVSIIDAHAGGLGLLGAPLDGKAPTNETMEQRLALIGGTSSCHMAVSREPKYLRGIWGPYYSAMIPGLWLTEGGQSATGALIDHVVFSHARGVELREEAKRRGTHPYSILNEHLDRLAAQKAYPAELTRELHVFPDFHGNRSPRADPTLRGMVSGLKLSDTVESLALLYLATIQAVAHGTKHIIDTMNAGGYSIDTLLACGGDIKNPVFVREHADVTGCRIVLPREPEAVLLGSSILGAVASGDFPSVLDAMSAMNHAESVVAPGSAAVRSYHAQKHGVFGRMYEDQLAYRQLMSP